MILWLLKRKLRRRARTIYGAGEIVLPPVVEPAPDPREEHFASRFSLGMMKPCFFSSKANAEMNLGPRHVLRNERNEPILKVRVEAPVVEPR